MFNQFESTRTSTELQYSYRSCKLSNLTALQILLLHRSTVPQGKVIAPKPPRQREWGSWACVQVILPISHSIEIKRSSQHHIEMDCLEAMGLVSIRVGNSPICSCFNLTYCFYHTAPHSYVPVFMFHFQRFMFWFIYFLFFFVFYISCFLLCSAVSFVFRVPCIVFRVFLQPPCKQFCYNPDYSVAITTCGCYWKQDHYCLS